MTIRSEFDVHMYNDEEVIKAKAIAIAMSGCLDQIELVCGKDGRDLAIVRTKMQEASYFARRAISKEPTP